MAMMQTAANSVKVSVATHKSHCALRRRYAAAHSGRFWYLEINDRNWFNRVIHFTAA